VDLKIGKEDRV